MTDQEMLKEIYEGMHKLQNVVERVENEVKSSKKEINGIQLTLENVTNINIIAEAHSDLSRKLDEAVKIDSETPYHRYLIRNFIHCNVNY